MSKQYKPNIVRGGVAVPLGNNYFFMKGRKHKQGGIDVGKDLEVEDGEVMKLTKDNIKVFSAVPFLNGQSPVEKLLGGENPNKVFAQQERFKKVNKINDDGTKAKYGKRKINTQNIPESEQYAVTTPNGQRKVFNNKEEVQQYITANTPKGYSLYDTTNYGSNIDKGQTAILDRNTEREIEKATEEEIKTNARKANIESNKEYATEALNAMPIIGDGMDIYSIVKDAYNKNYGDAALTAGMMLFPFDKFLKPVGKSIKKLYTNITDRLNTNTNLIDLNTNLFNNEKLEEPTLFIEDDGKVKEVFPTPVYKNNLPDLHFDDSELNKIDNYFKNIYLKRYLRNRNVNVDNINLFKSINNSTVSTDLGKIVHTNPNEIEYLKETGGGFSENGIAYLDDSYKTILPPTHEIRHNHRDSNLESQDFFKNGEESATRLDGGIYKYPISEKYYTKKEVDLVQNGYMFPKGFENKMSEHQVLAEKANLNSDLQLYLVDKYNLQDDTQLVSKIEELSNEDLFNLLGESNSPYAKKAISALRILRPNKDTYNAVLNNMKEALKYVPATIGVGTGLSLINNNENNQYKYGGKMNRQKAPLGILKKIGQSLGLIEKDKKTYTNDTHWGVKQDIKNGKIHIGGKPNEARQKYFDLDKEFTDSVKAVSKRYGLNPNLVASRIAKEGPIDYGIELVNDSIGFNREQMDGAFWGLDDLGTHLAEGRVTIKEPWNRIKSNRQFTNEKGRDTNSVYSTEWVDGIYGTAAELKYRRDYMKKHFPNMTDEQLDAAAAASFNRGNYGARKWINNKGNYMQYKPFIQLKQMGGNHKLNTNQMANIYRVDSNGKTTWGMNFSTGGKSKGRQKAELGLKTKNDGSYYGYPKKDNKGNTWYIPTDEDLKLMYPGLAEDVDYNTLSDYDKKRYDEREGVREGYRVLPTGGIFYSDNETIFVNDEIDVNREIPNSKLRRKYWNNLSTYENRLYNQVEPNKTNVVTPSKIKSTINNKSVNYSVTNKKQTTPKQTTSNNVTRTAPIAKSTSQETPIFGLDAQNAFKKSIVGSKSNPDYIRGIFDFRDNKELVNKIDPNTIKVNPTNIRYKGAPSNGNYFKNYNAGDYISLGANVLGNIGSALINKHTLDNMEYASAPVPKMAIKQKTNFNINPQLDLSRERLRESVSDINTNTASSSTALNRNNKLRLANIMNTNQLYGTKENMETQLINADRMNQQNVFNSNIDAFNTWNKEKNIFETAKQEKYGENKVGAVQGISQAVHDFINNNEKRRQFNNSLISIMAANPNINPELYKILGADWVTNEHIRNWKLANNYKV